MRGPLPAGPFEAHLRAAIRLNWRRAPRYAACSDGASRQVSWMLIASELVLLPAATWFDRRAAPFERAGVPVLDAVFESMDTVPSLCNPPGPPPPGAVPTFPVVRTGRQLREAFSADGFAGAAAVLTRCLARLDASSAPHCMVRHVLESARRICTVAPPLAALSAQRRLPSPERMHAHLLRLHLWSVAAAAYLDRRAYPLQVQGVPVLQCDLPAIPPWPTAYPELQARAAATA